MPKFNEAELEQSIIELMKAEGWSYNPGEQIVRNPDDVVIAEDLRIYLRTAYASEGITEQEVEAAILALSATDTRDIYAQNVAVMRRIMDGFALKRTDPTKLPLHINVIDFEHPERNTFRFVNQFEIEGECLRIPDGIAFVNGLPLVVFEFKNAIKENTTIENAYTQLTVRYRHDIPDLFRYNAFVVISDGVNNKFGSIFASYDFFYGWRKVEHTDTETEGINSLFSMIRGLFRPERLLEVVHNFIFFPDVPSEKVKEPKIVCRYPQYFAATLLHDNIIRHSRLNSDGDGKGGTYFGATGCGKSFTMLFLARRLMRDRRLNSPTLLFITDRTDLDDQLSQQIINAKKFIGDDMIMQIDSRENLGKYLEGRSSGGVFLTTIQKFTEGTGLLSDRANIVCISDEAHRTQTKLDQTIEVTDKGIKKRYGFAKFLRDSLPNATFVGFSGTPVDATFDAFGDEVDRYTMSEAVADGITRKIVYEGRASKVILDNDKVKEIQRYYDQCAEKGATEYQIEESKKAMTRMDVILNDPDLLANIAQDMVSHYERRIQEGSTVEGKAMIVVSSREVAWNLYQAIIHIRPEWAEVKECIDGETLTEQERKEIRPMARLNMVMTRGKDDPGEMKDLLGPDEYRKTLDKQFKAKKSNFKIAIVVDMWITGFDVPSLDTMYCFKPLQKHTLIQTISRVNRVYPGKEKGLVVDYLGIKNKLNEALKHYGGGDLQRTSVETLQQSIKMVKDELDLIRRMFLGFDFSRYHTGSPLEQLTCLNEAVEFILRTKESETLFMGHCRKMRSAYNICCNSEEITDSEVDDILFFFAVRSVIFKLTHSNAPDAANMNRRVAQMMRDAIISEEVEEINKVGAAGDEEIDILSEKYLQRLNALATGKNVKVALMEKLLKQVISSLQKVNKVKGIDFAERLAEIVKKYNDRSEDASATEIIDDVLQQMADLLHDVAEERTSGDRLGISFEEKAFFDILKAVAIKYNFYDIYGDDQITPLAKAIKEIVDDKSKYTDWSNRTDIKAELQMAVLMCMAAHKFPPKDHYDEVYKEILEQAENFKKHRVIRTYSMPENDALSIAAEP